MSDVKVGDLKLMRRGAQLIVLECVKTNDKRIDWKQIGYMPFNETPDGGVVSEPHN